MVMRVKTGFIMLVGLIIILLFSLLGCGTSYPHYNTDDPNSLRNLADQAGIYIGAAAFSSGLNESPYPATLAEHFNMLVAEWEMKFDPTEYTRDQFNFTWGDSLVNFAQANNMAVRGHALIWYQAVPSWVTNGTWTQSELLSIMQNHITKVVDHFKGKVGWWDVVNEAISDSSPYNLRTDRIWYLAGSDYIDKAFQAARAADPNVKLFYNDYGGEGQTGKADAIYNLVKGMKDRGIPIDGVGFQMHIDIYNNPLNHGFEANIKRFTDLGLEVHITEMDVRVPIPATQSNLDLQARIYHDIMAASLRNPTVTAFLTWGFTDKHTWIDSFFPGFGEPLYFDKNYRKKPAYYGVQSALKRL
jgi:endo-1,4-beta-xylanase